MKKLARKFHAPLTVLAAAWLITGSACLQAPYQSKDNLPGSAVPGAAVVYLDKDLRRVLVADKVVADRNAAGLLDVQVTLHNATNDETLSIQARAIFFDAAGRALYTDGGSEAAWQNFTLTPGQTARCRQNALTVAAHTSRFEVRYMTRR
jgi:hypothetical protein